MSAAGQFSSWEDAVRWLRLQPEQQALVMAAYYDDPLPLAAARYAASEEWQAIRLLLPAPRGTALDVGAGRGIASFALAQEGFAVSALEPDGSCLVGAEAIRGLAKESGLPISVVQHSSELLPFPDNTFDVVFARAVLHHTADLAASCREFHRVLKPGGRLVAVREHVISRAEDLPAFLDLHPLHKLYGGENAFLLSDYVRAIAASGLRLVTTMAPFDSPINYAPHTLHSLRREIAGRLSLRKTGLGRLIELCLGIRPLWAAMRPVMNHFDHRPGRLYTFVARKV